MVFEIDLSDLDYEYGTVIITGFYLSCYSALEQHSTVDYRLLQYYPIISTVLPRGPLQPPTLLDDN